MAKIIVSKKTTTNTKNSYSEYGLKLANLLIKSGYSLCGVVKTKVGKVKTLVYKNKQNNLENVPVDNEYKSKRANSLSLIKIKNATKASATFVKNESQKLQNFINGKTINTVKAEERQA